MKLSRGALVLLGASLVVFAGCGHAPSAQTSATTKQSAPLYCGGLRYECYTHISNVSKLPLLNNAVSLTYWGREPSFDNSFTDSVESLCGETIYEGTTALPGVLGLRNTGNGTQVGDDIVWWQLKCPGSTGGLSISKTDDAVFIFEMTNLGNFVPLNLNATLIYQHE